MKKDLLIGMMIVLASLLAACSNDLLDPGADGPDDISPADKVYMTLRFDMPSAPGSRSYTDGNNQSSGGVEIGSDVENKVNDIILVLAKKDNSYIASVEVPHGSVEPVGTTGRSYQSTASFSKTDIAQYYSDPDAFEQEIRVFVFCNPTEGLKTALAEAQAGNTDWFNLAGHLDIASGDGQIIWNDNAFLMSNRDIATRLFPETLADWDDYSTEGNPFKLSGMNNLGRPNEIDNFTKGGNIAVERVAARFDFRDGSIDGAGNDNPELNGIGNQTYEVLLDAENAPLVNVRLGKMALVNLNKDYYYLSRVSPTGLNQNVTLCGPELPWYGNASGADIEGDGNYVVDVNAQWKYAKTLPETGYSTYFNYPLFLNGKIDNVDASHDRWDTYLISDVLNGTTNDNPDSWNAGGAYKGYKVWRYATENTIPGKSAQRNGISTGVVFKGQMLPAPGRDGGIADNNTKDLLEALRIEPDINAGNSENSAKLYLFSGHLYAGWRNLCQGALSLAITNLKQNGDKWEFTINRSVAIYHAVFGNGGFGTFDFTYNETDADGNITSTKTIRLTDNLDPDETSANTKHQLWVADHTDNDALKAFKAAAVGAKITIYERSYDADLGGWGYYCYYYYWNRHNDNGMSGVMGPMEFAVVRNNVYKLAVTKVSRLGHPRIAENDPDAPTPNTPDEKSDIYITVNCTTLPWVVRLNDIVF